MSRYALRLVFLLAGPLFLGDLLVGRVDGETVGNPLIAAAITDTAPGSIFRLNGAFTQPGRLTDWGIYDAEGAPPPIQVTPVIYQRDGANWRITGIGTPRTSSGLGAQEYPFGLVSGSAAIVPGSFFGWKDGSNGADNGGVIDFTDAAPGTVDWLGPGHTTFAVGNSYGVAAPALPRVYSIQADTQSGGSPAETIGNPVIDRPNNDGAVGSLFVMTSNPFTETGDVWQWRFSAGNPRQMTPLIVEDVDGNYVIRGIGATISSDGSGEQHFSFDLVSGSDFVGPNYYFGWKDGGNGTDRIGVAEWSDGGPGTIWFGPSHTTFAVGDNLGVGTLALNRTYSIVAHSEVIPEPSTFALASIAAAMFVVRRRRR